MTGLDTEGTVGVLITLIGIAGHAYHQPMNPQAVVRDWLPSEGIPEDCPYLNISPESLEVCIRLAKQIPSQSPIPERWLYADHLLWKIGDWQIRRPLREALLDVLIDHLKYTFGMPWFQNQIALPPDQQHVVIRWWFEMCASQRQAAPKDHVRGQMFPVPRTGYVTEFSWLADDLYRLRLAGALDPAVLNRLRMHEQYQGARYEIAVAASLVRSGFDIKWMHGTVKHCEFEATQKLTKERIAVEVKSRHVRGTLNEPSELPKAEDMRFIAHRYYNEALRQCPMDRPCAIFIDLNLPPEVGPGDHHIPWWSDMQRMIEALPRPTATSPAVETCLVLTNFSAHYLGGEQAPRRRYVYCFPKYVRHPLRNNNTFIAILRAIDTYGEIPTIE